MFVVDARLKLWFCGWLERVITDYWLEKSEVPKAWELQSLGSLLYRTPEKAPLCCDKTR